MDARRVVTTVTGATLTDPREAMLGLAPMDLTVMFSGYGPLPAVLRVDDFYGPWDHSGAYRTPVLADDSQVREEIAHHDPGHYFAYDLTAFTGVLGRMVESARGEWFFAPGEHGGTTIVWRYGFTPRRGFGLAVRAGLIPLWRGYMRQGLRDSIEYLARERA